MSLADHYDPDRAGEGQRLREGRHPCHVSSIRFFDYKSGSRGVEFVCASKDGQTKLSFCLVSTIVWRLANFAAACGLSQTQMRRVNPETEVGFDVFVGRDIGIVVVKDEQGYHNGDDFFALENGKATEPATPPPAQQPAPVAASADDDDLPF